MIVKLLTEHHLECVSLKGGCRGSSESTHVKMPHRWKSHALAHICSFEIKSRECTKGLKVQSVHFATLIPSLLALSAVFTR